MLSVDVLKKTIDAVRRSGYNPNSLIVPPSINITFKSGEESTILYGDYLTYVVTYDEHPELCEDEDEFYSKLMVLRI